MLKKNGDIYEGDFANGKYQGKGKLSLKGGEYYIGEFKEGLMKWKTQLFSKEWKILYDGNFSNNKYNGNIMMVIL